MGILTPNEFGASTAAGHAEIVSSQSATHHLGHTSWRVYGLLTLFCLAEIGIILRQTLLAMISTWYSSRTFSHCFLVFPLVAFMVWQRRKRLLMLAPRPNPWALFPIAGLGLLWVLGNLGEVKLIEEVAFVGLVVAVVWVILGSAVVGALRLPLLFLFFAVPFGLGLIGPLQDVTAWFAVHTLNLSGIPAVLENRVLSVSTASWTVAEACSGIRYLFSSIMLGVIYSWSVYSSRTRRLAFVAASIVVPVLANGVRAYGIVLLAYLTNNRLAADIDHIVYGWLFFTIVQLMLFVVGLRWRQAPLVEIARTSHPPASSGPPQEFPQNRALATATLAAVLIAVTPVCAHSLWNRVPAPELLEWPDTPITVVAPWISQPTYDTSWAPDLSGGSKDFFQTYVSGTKRVDVYWTVYSGAKKFQLVSSYNRLSNPKRWSVVGDGAADQAIGGKPTRVHRTLIQAGSISRIVWTWYCVGGENTGSPTRLRFLQMKDRLLGISPSTIVLAVSTDSSNGMAVAEAIAKDFFLHASFLCQPVSQE